MLGIEHYITRTNFGLDPKPPKSIWRRNCELQLLLRAVENLHRSVDSPSLLLLLLLLFSYLPFVLLVLTVLIVLLLIVLTVLVVVDCTHLPCCCWLYSPALLLLLLIVLTVLVVVVDVFVVLVVYCIHLPWCCCCWLYSPSLLFLLLLLLSLTSMWEPCKTSRGTPGRTPGRDLFTPWDSHIYITYITYSTLTH